MLRKNNRRVSAFLASLSITVLCFSPVLIEAHCSQQEGNRVCYYVIHNTTDSVLREVYILMDESDFTEPILRRLLDQFRERYKEPNMLISLYSKLDQLYAFSGNEPVGSSHAFENKAPKPWNKNAKGVLIYLGVNQVIRYNTAGSELHTTVVKGVDPFSHN